MNIPDRTTLLKGPAYASFNGATIHFSSDLIVDLVTEFEFIRSSSFGPLSRIVKNRYITIAGTPMMWSDLAVLFPYATSMPEDSIYGDADKAMVITPRNGRPLTIKNVAVTKMPGLSLHPTKSIMRDMAFTGLVAKGADPKLQASYFEFGAAANNVAQTGLDLAKIPNTFYTAEWASESLHPLDGIDIDFNLTLEDDLYQGLALNKRVKEIEAVARFVPSYLGEDELADLLAWANQPGEASNDNNLVIAGAVTGSPKITLAKMMIQQGQTRYGGTPRAGELQFASVRQISAGALGALWTFDTVAES